MALWFGLLGAGGEVLILAVRRLLPRDWMLLGENVAWLTPVADVALALLLAGVLLPLVRWRGWRFGAGLLVTSLGAFGAFSILLNLPWIEPEASLVLALGIGVATARRATGAWESFRRLVRRTLPIVAGGVILWAAGTAALVTWQEHRRLAALGAARAGAPNIILVVLDTVGALWLNGYGYGRQTAPFLAEYARQGVQFDWVFATTTWTLPSHASMFTGHYAHEVNASWRIPLDGAFPTLAEKLGAAGYVSAGFAANQAYLAPRFGLQRGFTHFAVFTPLWLEIRASSSVVRWLQERRRVRRLIGYHDQITRKRASVVNEEALRWLENRPSRPFFLFLNYFDAHEPYLPEAPYDRRFGPGHPPPNPTLSYNLRSVVLLDRVRRKLPAEIQARYRDAYDGGVAYLDDQVRLLFGELSRRGLLDSSIVIITADHGEGRGEGDHFVHGYDLNLTDGLVPLIVVYPAKVPAGRHVAERVSLRDLAATIVDVAGVADVAPFPGTSLAPLWQGHPAETSPLISHLRYFDSKRADGASIIEGGRHYIRDGYGCEFLFDVDADPYEATNLIGSDSASAAAMRSRLDSLLGKARLTDIPCQPPKR